MFYVKKKTRKEKIVSLLIKKSVFVFISGVYILYLGCQIYAISLRNNENLCPSKKMNQYSFSQGFCIFSVINVKLRYCHKYQVEKIPLQLWF